MRVVKTLLGFAVVVALAVLYVRGETGIIESSYDMTASMETLKDLDMSCRSLSVEVAKQTSSHELEKKFSTAGQISVLRWEVARTLYSTPARADEDAKVTMRSSR